MGAWGTGNFDNDTACDWAYGLEGINDLSLIENTIESVFNDEDADVAMEALAAIDVLARLKGQMGVKNSYTERVDNWVSSVKLSVSDELVDKANKVIALILGPSSELFELWSESDYFSAWQKEITSLKNRLNT